MTKPNCKNYVDLSEETPDYTWDCAIRVRRCDNCPHYEPEEEPPPPSEPKEYEDPPF